MGRSIEVPNAGDGYVAKRRLFLSCLILPAVLVVAGCATSHHEVLTPTYVPGQRGVVFSVDGAGAWQATSASLQRAIVDARLPLGVEPFEWSHGYGRFLADQMDYEHARAEGQCLAAKVAACRQTCPGGEVYLVAHSAGSAVVLAAAESLPPASVDRIVLLAPSVSADYDLRPALRCVRYGMDVFSSKRDFAYLGLGTALVGTADRKWGTAAAGRTGFRPEAATMEDTLLLDRLRQHPWDPCVAWTGNHGGHYGGYQQGYLRAYVLPLLVPQ